MAWALKGCPATPWGCLNRTGGKTSTSWLDGLAQAGLFIKRGPFPSLLNENKPFKGIPPGWAFGVAPISATPHGLFLAPRVTVSSSCLLPFPCSAAPLSVPLVVLVPFPLASSLLVAFLPLLAARGLIGLNQPPGAGVLVQLSSGCH